MQNRICSEKNKEKEFVSKINHELTPDVVYHRVYMDHSMDHIAQFLFYIICVDGVSYFIGSLMTNQGTHEDVLFNLLIGYFFLSILVGFAVFGHIVFKACVA